MSLLNQRMPAEVGALYLEEYFSTDAELAIYEMVENMRETMIWKISRLDWMSEETKLKAIVKAKQMLFKMGYAKMLTNVTVMDQWSAGFQVQENNTILQSWIDLVELDFREGMWQCMPLSEEVLLNMIGHMAVSRLFNSLVAMNFTDNKYRTLGHKWRCKECV